MATPEQALAKLRTDPVSFLKNYHLTVSCPTNADRSTRFYIGGVLANNGDYARTPRPDRVFGKLHMHNSKNFMITTIPGLLHGNPATLTAWTVVGTPSETVLHNRIPSTIVSRTDGPDIVLTSMLSGCTFVYEPKAHSVLMGHVKPASGTTGALLEADIRRKYVLVGGLEKIGAAEVFGGGGSYNSKKDDVTIIGIRSQQRWRLFAQFHTAYSKQVSRVVEFFNG